ncbi:MAG TPA: YezD family protein [Dehalococcoidia bacterium]|nr:YezD family protein [Dehalococcoidia bacterium]
MATSQDRTQQDQEEEMVREILRALRSIQFGSVQLIIQDGRVVQIEKTEKMRLQREAG